MIVKPTGCGMKYLFQFIFPLLRSGVEAKRGVAFCHSTHNASRLGIILISPPGLQEDIQGIFYFIPFGEIQCATEFVHATHNFFKMGGKVGN